MLLLYYTATTALPSASCGPHGDGTVPTSVLVVSTGRVGSNMVERAVPERWADASLRSSILPSTHHRPFSSTETSPYGLSRYDGVIHMVRQPIDVVLSYIESGALNESNGGSSSIWKNNNIDWAKKAAYLLHGRFPMSPNGPKDPGNQSSHYATRQLLRQGLMGLVKEDLMDLRGRCEGYLCWAGGCGRR
jgi:hypothetical protein